ncbi:hypothetical protein [Spirosoma flavum]|uniref:Uncharacterized protein n=1 Tax=Spirosoma flavum TaxID=2048557 RepID=A0ABW6AG20_9BACT
MKINQAIFWRVISAQIALVILLSFYWLSLVEPDYAAAALIFLSVIRQLLI